MSYVVTIQRKSPITLAELRAAIEDEPSMTLTDLSAESDGDAADVEWKPGGKRKPEDLHLADGSIDAYSPSDGLLIQMQKLARRLDARVVGEEGEDLTDVDVSEDTPSGCGPLFWIMLFIGILLMLYWVWN